MSDTTSDPDVVSIRLGVLTGAVDAHAAKWGVTREQAVFDLVSEGLSGRTRNRINGTVGTAIQMGDHLGDIRM